MVITEFLEQNEQKFPDDVALVEILPNIISSATKPPKRAVWAKMRRFPYIKQNSIVESQSTMEFFVAEAGVEPHSLRAVFVSSAVASGLGIPALCGVSRQKTIHNHFSLLAGYEQINSFHPVDQSLDRTRV